MALVNANTILAFSTWAVASGALHTLAVSWTRLVSRHVPDPYLDEVFHIRQAQTYCSGQFQEWDPKITTPPGLYLLSVLGQRIGLSCNVQTLRWENALLLSILTFNACLHYLIHRDGLSGAYHKLVPRLSATQKTKLLVRNIHVATNVCLFPVLFFFSGLYYTDIASTCFVLLQCWLQNNNSIARYPTIRSAFLFCNGILALLFRQTNIFWVAVFPAILDVLSLLEPEMYDVSFGSSTLEDYIIIPASILAVSLNRVPEILRTVWHYILLVLTFASLVIWNGSIVLGDKSNHIATLHLAQMLYVWPLVVFFSLPIIVPRILALVLPSNFYPSLLKRYRSSPATLHRPLLSGALLCVTLLSMVFIIHYNTVIHPFTLADNRHYVFYVFRILRSHPSIRYLVAPVYLLSSLAVLQAFSTLDHRSSHSKMSSKNQNVRKQQDVPKPSLPPETMTSYVLAWGATTTLTLVTAPLVEPRYFILPWIFWRLRVPGPVIDAYLKPSETLSSSSVDPTNTSPKAPNPLLTKMRYILGLLDHGDDALFLETAWFLAINTVTGYIFLKWGFEWPQEKGQIQRFMW